MATGGNKTEDVFSCGICEEEIRMMSTLFCQHSFCERCLTECLQTQTEVVNTRSITCPTCQQHTLVPHPDRPVEEWAGQMKPELYLTSPMHSVLENTVSESQNSFICEKEGKTTADNSQCFECEASVCEKEGKTTADNSQCSECEASVCAGSHHETSPNSSLHDIITPSEDTSPARRSKLKKSFKRFKGFCKDCKQSLHTLFSSSNNRTCNDTGMEAVRFDDGFTTAPYLHEFLDTKINQRDSDLRDVVVMKVDDVRVTVVTDSNNGVLSFYTRNGEQCSSQLPIDTMPWCLAVLCQKTVAVSVPYSSKIIIVGVLPDLELEATITTEKSYKGLAVLDSYTMAATSNNSPFIDVLDMKGHILRTIPIYQYVPGRAVSPLHLHVTSEGNFVISDYGIVRCVTCLTQTGDVVFRYEPTGDMALMSLYGIESTPSGDIVVVDCSASRVILLNRSGEFIRDILTREDGLPAPVGLYIYGDRLYIASVSKGVFFMYTQDFQTMGTNQE